MTIYLNNVLNSRLVDFNKAFTIQLKSARANENF